MYDQSIGQFLEPLAEEYAANEASQQPPRTLFASGNAPGAAGFTSETIRGADGLFGTSQSLVRRFP